MRNVTIYGVTSHQAHAGSFVETYKIPTINVFPLGQEALMVERETAQRLQLQVHTIRRLGRSTSEYIAIEPELEAMLMLPITARLTEAEARAERHAREAVRLRQRLDAFNALPWYRRVWVTIWRDV